MRTNLRRPLAAGFVLSLLVPFMCGPILEDEFLCNEALARLQRCCDQVKVMSDFCADSLDCGSGHAAGLTPSQSHCILDLDCDSLHRYCVVDPAPQSLASARCP